MSFNGNIRSSSAWKRYEVRRREGLMQKYKGRFVVILSPAKKLLYLSDMVIAKLTRPDYVRLDIAKPLIGIAISSKAEGGFKVKYEKTNTPSINVETFIRDLEFSWEPGVYEARVEVIDAQLVDHYNLVVFDTSDHPAKTRVEKEE